MNSNFITNRGSRKTNQDVALIKTLTSGNQVFLVADGMGGYQNGAYAANFIVDNLVQLLDNKTFIDEKTIQSAIDQVTNSLAEENRRINSNMGATLGAVIKSDNNYHCFWVGDVKIWHIQNGKIIFESREHNLKNELIENNVFIEPQNARKYHHIVTRAIQNDIKKAKVDYQMISDHEEGDYIVIASDGVTEVLDNYELLNIINSKSNANECLLIFDEILKKQAKDNYTMVLY